MNSREKKHLDMLSEIGCVICREYGVHSLAEIHHISVGSGKRDHYMTAPLCPEHHRGAIGIHGMGVKSFLMLFNLSTEYHLIGLANKYRGN